MEALVLAGGLGTRLGPLTKSIPKPMLPVGGRPFLEWQLEFLAEQGVRRFILSVGYLGEKIRAHFGDAFRKAEIVYSPETSPLGTAGAVIHSLPLVTEENLLVIDGDTFQRLSLANLYEDHELHEADATLAIFHGPASASANLAEVNADERIQHIYRGRKGGRRLSPLLSGTSLIRTEALRNAASSPDAAELRSLENDLIPILIRDGRVFAHVSAAPYLDIGRPESYKTAADRLKELRA